MGYTTQFAGKFKLSRGLTLEEFNELKDLKYKVGTGVPGSTLQWVPTKDGKFLEWDGGEKFYYYTEWLEWLLEHFFKPKAITLDGIICYSGEEPHDNGLIKIQKGKVVQIENNVNITYK